MVHNDVNLHSLQVKVLLCPKPERPKTPEKVVVIPPPPELILQGPLEGEAAPAPPQLEMVIGLPELDTSGYLPLGRFSCRHQGNSAVLPTAQVSRSYLLALLQTLDTAVRLLARPPCLCAPGWLPRPRPRPPPCPPRPSLITPSGCAAVERVR